MPIDKSSRQIKQMFGEISPRYDFLNHLLSGGTDFYWRWCTVRHAPPEGDAPILDVCTGTGDLAFAYHKHARSRVSVVGTDFTHQMLVLANQKRAQYLHQDDSHATTLEFVEADAQQLPFDDNRFQIVSVAFGLRNVSDTQQGLQEMARVCKPGGKVVVLEFSMPANRLFRVCYGWYFRNILPRIGQWLACSRSRAYNYLPASVSEFFQDEKLAKLMKETGLREITWKPLTFGIATLYIGVK